MAGPDSPPVTLASTGRPLAVSIFIPTSVLMRVSPSAPAASAARATPQMSATCGDNFTSTGKPVRSRTAATMASVVAASSPTTRPPSHTFGHETFNSKPLTPGTVSPAMLTMTGTSHCSQIGAFSLITLRTPMFWRPMALSIPAGVSATRGPRSPARGRNVMLLQTMAPSFWMSNSVAYSVP